MKSNIEKILILFVLIITLSACGKSNRNSGTGLESGQQAASTSAPAILVKELNLQTSLGNTILDVYTGSPNTTDVNFPVGTLSGTMESQQYNQNAEGLPSPTTEDTPMAGSFPVYYEGMGTAGVRFSVFVDANTAALVAQPFISDSKPVFKVPLNFCSDYLLTNLNPAYPIQSEYMCSYPDAGEPACVYKAPTAFKIDCDGPCRHQNYLNIQNNLKDYECKQWSVVYPQVLTEEDYVKLNSLTIAIDPMTKDLPADANNQAMHITEDQWSITL